MISLSSKSLKNIAKYLGVGIAAYSTFFLASSIKEFYDTSKEKEELTNTLQLKRDDTNVVKKQIDDIKKRKEYVENAYISSDELKSKVDEIFKRVTTLDYQLYLLDVRKECVDRHIIVANLDGQSEKGYQAGEGILKFLGETLQSQQSENLYFVNYIALPKEKK